MSQPLQVSWILEEGGGQQPLRPVDGEVRGAGEGRMAVSMAVIPPVAAASLFLRQGAGVGDGLVQQLGHGWPLAMAAIPLLQCGQLGLGKLQPLRHAMDPLLGGPSIQPLAGSAKGDVQK